MIATLPLFHRVAGVPVIVLGQGEAAAAKRRLVERAGARVSADVADGLARGARLAFIAHEDAAAAEVDAARLREAGVLVNVADRPALCDFLVPAVIDRDPVLIAVGTGGASAGLAKALRLRIEAMLPAALGALATALHAGREDLRGRLPAAADRRRALDAALAGGGALDPLRQGSEHRVAAWLTGPMERPAPKMAEVDLRSPDPDDLTLREARLLGTADVIVHDSQVPTAILERARADAVRLCGSGMAASEGGLVVRLRMVDRASGAPAP